MRVRPGDGKRRVKGLAMLAGWAYTVLRTVGARGAPTHEARPRACAAPSTEEDPC